MPNVLQLAIGSQFRIVRKLVVVTVAGKVGAVVDSAEGVVIGGDVVDEASKTSITDAPTKMSSSGGSSPTGVGSSKHMRNSMGATVPGTTTIFAAPPMGTEGPNITLLMGEFGELPKYASFPVAKPELQLNFDTTKLFGAVPPFEGQVFAHRLLPQHEDP